MADTRVCKRTSRLWKPALYAGACLLLAGLGLAFIPASMAQTPADPLLGQWSGLMRFGGESQRFAMRFEVGKNNATVVFYDTPDLKFTNIGPIPVHKTDDGYKIMPFEFHSMAFHLAPDNKSISGIWTFDGHEVPFELQPGPLQPATPPAQAAGRTAEPLWKFEAGGAIWGGAAVADGVVYFGSTDTNLYALTEVSGKQIWQFKTGGYVMGTPTIAGRYIYVNSDDGFLYKLERKTGKLVWKFDTRGGAVARDVAGRYDTMESSPAVAGGTVYVGSADKRLYAVDDASGNEKWHFDTQDIVRSTPAVADGRVFIGSFDHYVYAVDAKTGALIWKHDTLRDVVSSPLVAGDTVYIGSRCSDLFAFDAATGNVKWKFFYWSSWVESSARIRDGIVYVGSSDIQDLYAINAATGKKVWEFSTDGSAWSVPAVTDKLVYIGAVGVQNYFVPHHGGFFAVDRATGKEVWWFPMGVVEGRDTYGVASSPAVDHGMVFFGGLDHKFYAFRAEG